MRVLSRLACLAALATSALASGQQAVINNTAGLLLPGRIANNAGASSTFTPGTGYQLSLPSRSNWAAVLDQPANWSGLTHLDCRVRNTGSSVARLTVAVSSGFGGSFLTSGFILVGGATRDISVALTPANGIRCLPSIADRLQVTSDGTILKSQVGAIFVYNDGGSAANIVVESVTASSHNLPTGPLVDVFGQQRAPTWAGKVHTIDDLRAGGPIEIGDWPYAADSYGGIVNGPQYAPAQRFRVLRENGSWFLISPSGRRFFSMGVNEVGAVAWTQTQGRESTFTDLATLQANYPHHFTIKDGQLGYIPYALNLEIKHGPNWGNVVLQGFKTRMQLWGFNTFGANSWDSFMSQQTIPSTMITEIEGNHHKLQPYDHRKIHDPFDPAFRANAHAALSHRITPGWFTSHAYNLGYFVDNELPWGDPKSPLAQYRYAIAIAALKAPPAQPARKAIVRQLVTKYRTISRLNRAWNTSYRSFAILTSGTIPVPPSPNTAMQNDLRSFQRLFARQYFSTIDSIFAQLNYKGLYLGCRFTYEYPPEVIEAAKEYVDVLSFNMYSTSVSAFNSDLRSIDFPILISEVCFGANDLGRVGVPLNPTLTEQDRVEAFRRYMQDIRTYPNIVGVHWYRWEDFPVTGKQDRYDNASMGLVSITDQPYAGVTAETRSQCAQTMDAVRLR